MAKTALTTVIRPFTDAAEMIQAAKAQGAAWRKRSHRVYLGDFDPRRQPGDLRHVDVKATLFYNLEYRRGAFSLVVGSSCVPLSDHRIRRLREAFGVPAHVPTETLEGGLFVRLRWQDAAAERKAA